MKVHLPTHLRSYSAGAASLDVEGRTVREILDALEARSAGFRIRVLDEQNRIRPHITVFVGQEQVRSVDAPVSAEVTIVGALSGG